MQYKIKYKTFKISSYCGWQMLTDKTWHSFNCTDNMSADAKAQMYNMKHLTQHWTYMQGHHPSPIHALEKNAIFSHVDVENDELWNTSEKTKLLVNCHWLHNNPLMLLAGQAKQRKKHSKSFVLLVSELKWLDCKRADCTVDAQHPIPMLCPA